MEPIGTVYSLVAEPVDDIRDEVKCRAVETGARHSRGRGDRPLTGIFAQRVRNRPNRIGVTICRLLSGESLSIEVRGLAIDGTPVPEWATQLMAGYRSPA